MGQTPIEWVRRFGRPGFTVNPIRFRNLETGHVGHYCEKISPGCKFCYSDKLQMNGFYKLSGLPFRAESLPKGELFLDQSVLDQVLSRRDPTAYFWCDMTDLFGRWVPYEWIDACITTMVAASQHRHMILTKRPDVALEYFTSGRQDNGNGPDRATVHLDDEDELPAHLRRPAAKRLDIWIGVSVEDQERKSRLDTLRKIPASHRFVSFEPLLEDLALQHDEIKGVDLAIFGGESGAAGNVRDCYVEWIRHGMAVAKSAGAMVFVKQLGRRPVDRNGAGFDGKTSRSWPADTAHRIHPGEPATFRVEPVTPMLVQLKNTKGGDIEEWPTVLRVRELPQ